MSGKEVIEEYGELVIVPPDTDLEDYHLPYTEPVRPPRTRGKTKLYDVKKNGPLPEIRTVRPVQIVDRDFKEAWFDFESDLGRHNRGRGKFYAIGTLAITYVSASEWSKMLAGKYPDAYESPYRLHKLQDRVMSSYRRRISANQQAQDAELRCRVQAKLGSLISPYSLDFTDNDMAFEVADHQSDSPQVWQKWGYADFVTRDLKLVGGDSWAITFEDEWQSLAEEEMEDAIQFCKEERLDVNAIKHRDPHVTIMEPYNRKQPSRLYYNSLPAMITFAPPTMY